jgi:beta-glucosidase
MMAQTKHFAMNEQETKRLEGSNTLIDERLQMEMYYPPFEASVKAGVGSLMCSYNQINGVDGCGNNVTLNYHLRDLFGFKGFVVSDWGGIRGGPKEYLKTGCELEMGSFKLVGPPGTIHVPFTEWGKTAHDEHLNYYTA